MASPSGQEPELSASRFYTEGGDPARENAIAAIVGAVARRAAEVPDVEAVLLGGSLGRGEASARLTDAGAELESDVEIYLVGRSRALRSAAARLQKDIRRTGVDCSVAWLHPAMLSNRRAKNLSWQTSPSIRLYELAAGSRVLSGSPPEIAPTDATELPLAEGIRLILNRLAEGLPYLITGDASAVRWADKVLIACGDTMLLVARQYDVLYRTRAQRLASLAEPWPMPTSWRPSILEAYERKLAGMPKADQPAAELAAIVRAALAGALPLAVGEQLDPLASLPERFAAGAARRAEMLRYLPPLGRFAQYEAVIVLLRAARADLGLSWRALARAIVGRPLSLALLGAAVPLFMGSLEQDAGLVSTAAQALRRAGVPGRELDGPPLGLSITLRRYWQATS